VNTAMIDRAQLRISSALCIALVLPAMLGGCQKKAVAETPEPVDSATLVDTTEVGQRPMPATLKLNGTLKGQKQADIAANAQGRVVATLVERGAAVKAGQVLARLDVRAAALSAAEAKANTELAQEQRDTAERECERYAKLLERKAITQQEYDKQLDQCVTSKLSVTTAEVRARSATQTVSDGSIRAPFAGVIGERFVETGEYVRADSKVVTLIDLDRLRLEFTVPEANLEQVTIGAKVGFTVPSHQKREFSATVKYLGAAVRESTRDVVVEAVLENPEHTLRPGMFATLELELLPQTANIVPKTAVVQRDGQSRVFVVKDHRIEERVVQLGTLKDNLVAIRRGLREHEQVVTAPSDNLRNGQKVN
jgi:membrane fusion protein, multidrug efflux system